MQPTASTFRSCNRYDYLLAVACGAVAGLVDIFFVNTPGNSSFAAWTDAQTDNAVMMFAKMNGWNNQTKIAISN